MALADARILVAQIGARRQYAVPILLHRAGMLGALVTDAASTGFVRRFARMALALGMKGPIKRLGDRNIPEVSEDKIVSFPAFGFWRVMRRLAFRDPSQLRGFHAMANARFGKLVSRLKLCDYDAVYVFNAAGLEIARAAKEVGCKVILDQTAAPVRVEEALLAEERERWQGWERQETHDESWHELARREEEEWQLADVILCGSQYVRDSLIGMGVSRDKCRVVPTAMAETFATTRRCSNSSDKRRFTVLFAGTLCLRKGIPYLVEVAKRFNNGVVFRVAGASMLSDLGEKQVRAHVDYAGIVPRSQMPEEYRRACVLLLPTLSEGSAAVTYEALAMGVPVITTPNAGSVVREGVDGYIVPVRDVESICDRIEILFSQPDQCQRMAESAAVRAADFSWHEYGRRLVEAIAAVL